MTRIVVIALTQMTVADQVGNLNSDARQLAVVIDCRHACRCECNLVENVAVQLPWSKHSDRNDLNACHTNLICNGHCFLRPNGRRSVGYDDCHPRRLRTSSGVSLEYLVAEDIESCCQVVASAAEVADANDALLHQLAVIVLAEAELHVRSVAVTDKRDAQSVL